MKCKNFWYLLSLVVYGIFSIKSCHDLVAVLGLFSSHVTSWAMRPGYINDILRRHTCSLKWGICLHLSDILLSDLLNVNLKNRICALLRTSASHRCSLDSAPKISVTYGLLCVSWFSTLFRVVFPRVLRFFSLSSKTKPTLICSFSS